MKKEKVFFLLIIFFPILYISVFNLLNGYFFHDTLDYYRFFKYIFIFNKDNNSLPLWTPKLDNGLSTVYFYWWIGNIGLFFIKFGQFINVSAFTSYNLFIIFILIIFLYGIYLNLKKNNKSIEKFIFFCALFFGSTVIYRQIAWDLLIYLTIPYVLYWSEKFSRTGNIKNINKIILALILNFLLYTSYILVYTGYIAFIILIINFFLNNKSIYKIKNKLFNLNKIQLLFFFLLLLFALILKNYQHNLLTENYNVISPLREKDGTVTFETFSTYANYSILTLGYRVLILDISAADFNFYINPIFLCVILLLFLKKKIILDKKIYLFGIIGVIIFIIFFLNIKSIDWLLYNLPLFKYTRHLNIALIIAKPIFFLTLTILIIDNVNFSKKNNNNCFYKTNRFYYINNNKKIIFYTLCLLFLFNNFNQIFLLKDKNSNLVFDFFYKKDFVKNIRYNNTCDTFYENNYYNILNFPSPEKTIWSHNPVSVSLITEDIPCKNTRREEYKNKYDKKMINGQNLAKINITKNNEIEIIPSNLLVQKENITSISYSPKWALNSNDYDDQIKLTNYDGYLSIYLNSPLKEYSNFKLTYNDKNLKNYINFLQIFSMIEVLMFLIVFVKLIKKKIR